MVDIPALPDTERRTPFSITAQTGPFAVGFHIYADSTDYAQWVEVWLDGVKLTAVTDWTLDSPSGSLSTLARPITDARVTLTAPRTGTLQIVGARRPRRTAQVAENRGVTAHDFNQLYTDVIARAREVWDFQTRVPRVPPGEAMAVLPALALRANKPAAFDGVGNFTFTTSTGTAWLSGSGAPSAGLGKDTDIYLNTANGDLYSKQAGVWVLIANIIGPSGAVDAVETSVASAATSDIGAAATHRVLITGSVTITSLGTGASKLRFVRFSGAPLLTHNATSLILPGGQNIQAAAGDTAIFGSDGSGNWTCVAYKRADGQAIAMATTANFLANTADKVLGTDEVWASGALTALTDAATVAVDFSLGINFSVTLGGNRTLGNPSNTKVGQSGVIVITQDGTGTRTLAFSGNWKFATGVAPILTTTAGAKDYLYYFVESSTRIIGNLARDVK